MLFFIVSSSSCLHYCWSFFWFFSFGLFVQWYKFPSRLLQLLHQTTFDKFYFHTVQNNNNDFFRFFDPNSFLSPCLWGFPTTFLLLISRLMLLFPDNIFLDFCCFKFKVFYIVQKVVYILVKVACELEKMCICCWWHIPWISIKPVAHWCYLV